MQWTHLPQQLFFLNMRKLFCTVGQRLTYHYILFPLLLLQQHDKILPFENSSTKGKSLFCDLLLFQCFPLPRRRSRIYESNAMRRVGVVLLYTLHMSQTVPFLLLSSFSSHFWQKVSWWWLHVSLMAFEAFYLFQKVQEIHSTSIWSKMVPSPTAPL